MKNLREEHGTLEYNLERKIRKMSVTVKNASVLTQAVVDVTKKLDGKLIIIFMVKIFKMPISGGTMSESALHLLGHGNDIAYYNGNYYVAIGSKHENNDEKRIAQFPSNLKRCIHFILILKVIY